MPYKTANNKHRFFNILVVHYTATRGRLRNYIAKHMIPLIHPKTATFNFRQTG